MVGVVNKFGLKRYIPSEIRKKIRIDAGYGCVICGNLFVDYEHIQPEFNEAKVHDPDKMTLLCAACHDKVTRRVFSKQKVWKAKANPMTKKAGYARDMLDPNTTQMELLLGNSSIDLNQLVLVLHNKPILWFSKSDDSDSPYEINFILHNERSQVVGYINKNIVSGVVAENDITATGCRLEIKKDRVIFVEIVAKGGMPLKITRLNCKYINADVEIKRNGDLRLSDYATINNVNTRGAGNAAFCLEGAPQSYLTDEYGFNKSNTKIAIDIAMMQCQPIINYKGEVIGWLNQNYIIMKNYKVSGIVREDGEKRLIVSNVIDEEIGEMKKTKVEHNNYALTITIGEDDNAMGEPVWIAPNDFSTRNTRVFEGYDISYRFTQFFPKD